MEQATTFESRTEFRAPRADAVDGGKIADFDATLSAARRISPAFRELDDRALLDAAEDVETLGRLLDGWRVNVAAEIAKRASKKKGESSLAFRNGTKDAPALLAHTAQVSYRTAKQRIALGAATAPTTPAKPSRYPHVHEAITNGDIGVDAGRLILDLLQAVRGRVLERDGKPDGLRLLTGAEAMLVQLAMVEAPEELRNHIERWRDILDPDGANHDDEARQRARAFRLGILRPDGTTAFSGVLADPEERALLQEYLDSRRRKPMVQTPDGGDDDGEHESIEGEWRAEGDTRSRVQQDHDTLMDAIRCASAAEAAGSAPEPVPHEIVIVATADQVQNRSHGWTNGILGRLPIPTVEAVACEAGIRLLVTDPDGEPLYLGRSRRLFSAAQRKALLARSQGRCEMGGCTTPTAFLHAHHIRWHGRDEGPTDIDNAVMLCNHHHHAVHAADPPFRLERLADGIYAIPTGWKKPPAPQHRVREHVWRRTI